MRAFRRSFLACNFFLHQKEGDSLYFVCGLPILDRGVLADGFGRDRGLALCSYFRRDFGDRERLRQHDSRSDRGHALV